ncbi:hypothetical protein BDZ97DRAFT_1649965 [Flammula alnicola]|nr:hypothetical protein BDZ97DRAFT_1649965 [Flammula alnicola]
MSTASNKTTPPWPSLYNPGLEILHIEHHPQTQPGGAYLYHAKGKRNHSSFVKINLLADVFRFTLYWTLVFYTPIFLLCGSYAFWNYAFPPSPRLANPQNGRESYQLSLMNPDGLLVQAVKPPKPHERRSRVTFALIVLLTFLTLSVAGAVIGSAIMGFVTFGLYKAGNFSMSTWIPFLLAVMQVVIGLLSVWPSIVEII